jgi:Phage terminase large subunit (GpA)
VPLRQHTVYVDDKRTADGPVVTASVKLNRWVETKVKVAKPKPTLLIWALRVPEPKTGTLDFGLFPFQPGIYETFGGPSRDAVIRKGTQIGMSAMLVRWALSEADMRGRTVMYVMPTLGDVFDFADGRIVPLFEHSPYLWEKRGDPFNKTARRVGAGLCIFRGSENKRGLDSVDADCLALDEYDTLNQSNIPDAERRLSAVTSAGLIRRVGVPSLPEHGISQKYEESDRRMWLVRCSCGYRGVDRERGDGPVRAPDKRGGWQPVDFWRNVLRPKDGPAYIGCAGCGKPLDVAKGTWVAQQPDGSMPGFHVSRLLVPTIRLDEIIASSEKKAPFEIEVFYNKDLGLPFVSKEARLSPDDIKACQTHMIFSMVGAYCGPGLVTMGIDVASERALNVRISEHLTDDTGNFTYKEAGVVDRRDRGRPRREGVRAAAYPHEQVQRPPCRDRLSARDQVGADVPADASRPGVPDPPDRPEAVGDRHQLGPTGSERREDARDGRDGRARPSPDELPTAGPPGALREPHDREHPPGAGASGHARAEDRVAPDPRRRLRDGRALRPDRVRALVGPRAGAHELG